eukprot:1260992-Amphidinium_carterae.1
MSTNCWCIRSRAALRAAALSAMLALKKIGSTFRPACIHLFRGGTDGDEDAASASQLLWSLPQPLCDVDDPFRSSEDPARLRHGQQARGAYRDNPSGHNRFLES